MLEFLITLAIFFVGAQWALSFFFPDQFGQPQNRPALELLGSATVRHGHHPVLTLRNNTVHDISLVDRCPQPLVDIVFTPAGGEAEEIISDETVLPCEVIDTVPANDSITIDLAPWKYSLFGEFGTYTATLDLARTDLVRDMADPSATFELVPVGTITSLFRALVTKPLLNGLVFIAGLIPTHDLGLAIIIVTLLIKILLFFPSQHALEGQRKLQELQPKINDIKRQYKDDLRKQQEETMKLWKQYKVNPFQSCLPLLIQFPILIGLYFTIRDGAVLETSRHLLYSAYSDLPWSFDTMFLGLDLKHPSVFVFPPLLAVLQFVQMKLALRRRTKEPEKVIDAGTKKNFSIDSIDQQTMMAYVLPLMIAFFSFKVPAAVSLYWGVSTLFAIGQQWYVNKRKKL